jgi:predicted nucleic acid-binding protein
VLELALLQEQRESCESILSLCEEDRVRLVVPSYCLAEPHETLTRRHKQRTRMRDALDAEIREIARTASYSAQLSGFRGLTDLLTRSAQEDDRRLREVCSRLLRAADVIPLDASVLTTSSLYQSRHGFSPQDAIVYASVLSHLDRCHERKSYFISRDLDFDDQDVIEELSRFKCELLHSFARGHQFINRDLGSAAGPN